MVAFSVPPPSAQNTRLKLWHVLPIAAALHGLLLWIPVQTASNQPVEKPKAVPPSVKVSTLPQPVVTPSPLVSPPPPVAKAPPVATSPIVQPPVQQPIVQPQRQVVEQRIIERVVEKPAVEKPVQKPAEQEPKKLQAEPVPQPTVPVEKPVDAFQLGSSKPCKALSLCFQIERQGNTRLVAQDLKAQLANEYDIGADLDLDAQEPIIFRITNKKTGAVEYAHIFSTGSVDQRITHMLRLPKVDEFIALTVESNNQM
jgi:hypothetical protein